MRRASVSNSAPKTERSMLHRRADRRARRSVPKPECLVPGPGHDAPLVPVELRAPLTRPSCVIGAPIGAPVAASQSLSVLSSDHDRMRRSSCVEQRAQGPALMPHRHADRRARRHVPKPERVVGRPRKDAPLVLVEQRAKDRDPHASSARRSARPSPRPKAAASCQKTTTGCAARPASNCRP